MFEVDEMEGCHSCLYEGVFNTDKEPCKYCYGLSLYTKRSRKMGMKIDEAIKQLETYTIPCGRYKEAYDFAIDTMRKYQKIEQIVKEWGDSGLLQNQLYKLIREVVEDGND